MKSWIDNKADLVSTPYAFLCWYLGQWANDVKMGTFEECVFQFFLDHGVPVVELHWLDDTHEGSIRLGAGVQKSLTRPPCWMYLFIDGMGEDNMNDRYMIACALLDSTISCETEYARETLLEQIRENEEDE